MKKIDKQMATQRNNRGKMIRVALVGYTNVGKSTLMNIISKSEVFAENKLFATLDTTVRKVVVGNLPFLLSDTVGFIRKLPHHLVESFKSTLDEVREWAAARCLHGPILTAAKDKKHPGAAELRALIEKLRPHEVKPTPPRESAPREAMPRAAAKAKTDAAKSAASKKRKVTCKKVAIQVTA